MSSVTSSCGLRPSEVFATAWRKIDKVPERELPWLLGVAGNLARQSHGATGQARRLADRLADLTAAHSDRYAQDAADRVIARDHALAAFATLTAKDAEAIALTAWHGLEPADAARVAGCSRAAFLVRLHRARRRLAAALDASFPDSATGRAEPGRHVPEPGTRTTEPGTPTTGPGTRTTEPGMPTTGPGMPATGPGMRGAIPATRRPEADMRGMRGMRAAEGVTYSRPATEKP
jgi:DNA-directed RNA polymerase specialized sigma24 family protein